METGDYKSTQLSWEAGAARRDAGGGVIRSILRVGWDSSLERVGAWWRKGQWVAGVMRR